MSDLLSRLRGHQPNRPSQTLTRIGLGTIMTFAGITHLTTAREEFQAQVPDWFPMNKDLVVLGSGVAEISLGVSMLALPGHRRLTGTALAAFYTLIFPGNIAQYAERTDAFGLDTDAKRLIRLFGQPLLIAGALWAAGIPEQRR
ncbi:hypothetical protein COCCU_00435 [Corynebacterium occultum]|uniref:DoxX n=1 Tax=Corynebacterium occultum TaxID=2675219 RepID=A0A6B8W3S5_9CORY|nr:hypothetical protein [Corynebacterium occultum]QGU06055.1 hypothetical protein COCCU_00435 [Corynebacterium occultum]